MGILTSRPSVQAQVANRLSERARWARIAAELDDEFGTDAVEASMIAAGNDPDAYLASRQARYEAADWVEAMGGTDAQHSDPFDRHVHAAFVEQARRAGRVS